MSATPAVSVVMPVYNAEPYITAALRGVLVQTFTDFELIVVDDGSTDGSLGAVRVAADGDPRVRVITGPNRGVGAARNRCLDLARAPLMAVNDADDVSVSHRLQIQVKYLQDHPECVAVGGRMRLITDDGVDLGEHYTLTEHGQIDAWNMRGEGSAVGHSSVLMRTDVVRSIGGYRREYDPAEDFDLWLRLAERGKLANLPEALVDYRLHSSSLSHAQARLQLRNIWRAAADAHRRRGLSTPAPLPINEDNEDMDAGPPVPVRLRWMRMVLCAHDYAAARRLAYHAIRTQPSSALSWRLAGMGLLGPKLPAVLAALRALRLRD